MTNTTKNVSQEEIMRMNIQDLKLVLEKKKFPVSAVISRLTELGAGLVYMNSSYKNLLHFAAEEGDCESIELLLNARVYDINALDSRYFISQRLPVHTALHYACIKDHLEAVKLLVAYGANMNATSESAGPLIMMSIHSDNTEIFDFLLQQGQPISAVDSSGRNCLSEAAAKGNIQLIDRLVAAGFNPQHRSTLLGSTILYEACYNGAKSEVLKRILDFKLNPNEADRFVHRRPVDFVVANGDRESLNLIISYGGDVRNFNAQGMNGLHTACFFANLETAQLLLEMGFDPNVPAIGEGEFPIQLAVTAGCVPLIDLLLKFGAYPMIHAITGESLLIRAIKTNDVNVIDRVLRIGVDANEQAAFSKSFPLHYACSHASPQVIHKLIDYGAIPTVFDADKRTPLHLASSFNRSEIVYALLQRGAQVNAIDDNGQTAIDYTEDFEVKKILAAHGCKGVTSCGRAYHNCLCCFRCIFWCCN